MTAFLAYLDRLVADRRRHPGDPDKDILTRLIQGEVGERLSPEELLQNCIFILNAGHETTTNLIGNGLHLLAEHPEARARLLAEPDLMRKAVEEILRFESSNQLGNRVATTDFAIDGRTFPAGTQITLGIGAANRDPAQFPDPDPSTSPATPTATSPSRAASTTASAWRWRGWRAGSRSGASSPAFRITASTECRSVRRGCASGDFRGCRPGSAESRGRRRAALRRP